VVDTSGYDCALGAPLQLQFQLPDDVVILTVVGISRFVDVSMGSRCSSGTFFLRDIGLLAGGLLPFRPAAFLSLIAL